MDHESTPAQYLIRDAPDVTRLLVDHGAWFDSSIAVGLRDAALVERCLRKDPDASTTGSDREVRRGPQRQAGGDTRGDRRSPRRHVQVGVQPQHVGRRGAALLGYDDIVGRLLGHTSPTQRLVAACARRIAPLPRPWSRRSRVSCRAQARPEAAPLRQSLCRRDRGRRSDARSGIRFSRRRSRQRRRVTGRRFSAMQRWCRRSFDAIRLSACERRTTTPPRWTGVYMVLCTGGSRTRGISPSPSRCSRTRGNRSNPPICRPAATMWTPRFGPFCPAENRPRPPKPLILFTISRS